MQCNPSACTSSIPSLIVLPLQERGIPAGPKRIIVHRGLSGPIITIGYFWPFFAVFSFLRRILSKFLMPSLLPICESEVIGV